jgi:hypothetical protein
MSTPEQTPEVAQSIPTASEVGMLMHITSPARYVIVNDEVLAAEWVFDAARDIDGRWVSIYPPDVVMVKRVIDQGKHLICKYAGTLVVVPRKCLRASEVKLT